MKRMGMAIGIRPEKIDEYKRLHADAWPGVLRQIRDSNIRNYVIYLLEPENMLFAHLEYHGDDFEADMARMAEDPETQEWWTHTDPCQTPLAREGQLGNWVILEEVFYTD